MVLCFAHIAFLWLMWSDQNHVITWFETGAGGQNVGQVQADHIWKQNYTFTMENVHLGGF